MTPTSVSCAEGDKKQVGPLTDCPEGDIAGTPTRKGILLLFYALVPICGHRQSVKLLRFVIQEDQDGVGFHEGESPNCSFLNFLFCLIRSKTTGTEPLK